MLLECFQHTKNDCGKKIVLRISFSQEFTQQLSHCFSIYKKSSTKFKNALLVAWGWIWEEDYSFLFLFSFFMSVLFKVKCI